MGWYEAAAVVKPDKNDDSILRWNYCVRAIKEHRLVPEEEVSRELPLE